MLETDMSGFLSSQVYSPPVAYSYWCVNAGSSANKGDNLGASHLVTDGHHRCFDWFGTRLEGFLHGESEVMFKQPSIVAALRYGMFVLPYITVCYFLFFLTDVSCDSSCFSLSPVWNLIRCYVVFINAILEAVSRTSSC